jgi:hypothetical protein
MPAHLIEFLAGSKEFVALGELADDLIRRVPPVLGRCHVVGYGSLFGLREHNDRHTDIRHVDIVDGRDGTLATPVYIYTACARPSVNQHLGATQAFPTSSSRNR